MTRLHGEEVLLLQPHHAATTTNLDSGVQTLSKQHIDNLLSTPVAKELPELLFVIRDAVLDHQRDKVGGCETSESRFTEVRVRREKVIGG